MGAAEMRHRRNNCSDNRFGSAVFSDADINGTTPVKNLPYPQGPQPNGMAEDGLRTGPLLHTMMLCFTHISLSSYGGRDREVSSAAALVNTYVNWGYPVVLGGSPYSYHDVLRASLRIQP